MLSMVRPLAVFSLFLASGFAAQVASLPVRELDIKVLRPGEEEAAGRFIREPPPAGKPACG
jgi:hypothetical protein